MSHPLRLFLAATAAQEVTLLLTLFFKYALQGRLWSRGVKGGKNKLIGVQMVQNVRCFILVEGVKRLSKVRLDKGTSIDIR